MSQFNDATRLEISNAMLDSWHAFHAFRKTSLKQRANFMRSIAAGLQNEAVSLLAIATEETNLPEARLKGELTRTIFQLESYADATERGQWLEARIDTALPNGTNIRKMLVPLGPVVVFGASNFPFAYSTAGGDTACALAAGCPVVVKAHPAHGGTSEQVAHIILQAAQNCKMPRGVFAHLHGASFEVGKSLVTHPYTKAVGFTGSYNGGKALFDWANQREVPIPVFAEMGSTNPVFLMPEKLAQSPSAIAKMYASSITMSMGQFCTNPGIIVGIEGKELKEFIDELGQLVKEVPPAPMLHKGIAHSFAEKRMAALAQPDISLVASASPTPNILDGIPTIVSVGGEHFLNNPLLHQEVFGPYSMVVRCRNKEEMLEIARMMEGQLTATLMATEQDIKQHPELVEAVQDICGRFILNGVPTGVEVCLSMHHGGPFPATTDCRFTAVGADGIKRFARPVSYQGWPESLLPDELKDANPLAIYRTVNNELVR
jgi:alpha-ketoglutaric semialdehyde dehydrogenase